MQEGMWFKISGFVLRRVCRRIGAFNLTKHSLAILFNQDTVVRSIEPITNNDLFKFLEFEWIVGDRCDRTHPIGESR